MMRLTPDKIRGYGAMPDRALRINRGNTSIIYKTDDPALLEVFTTESIKMEWWRDACCGLDIIEDFDYVCDAHYSGYQCGAWWEDNHDDNCLMIQDIPLDPLTPEDIEIMRRNTEWMWEQDEKRETEQKRQNEHKRFVSECDDAALQYTWALYWEQIYPTRDEQDFSGHSAEAWIEVVFDEMLKRGLQEN